MNLLIKIFFLGFVLVFVSCEEVIDIDLNEANPQWVIEATINDMDNEAVVNISQTSSYFEPGEFDPGSGAEVSISSSNGDNYQLTEINPGEYRIPDVDLIMSEQYKLAVDFEGQVYEAFSTLQPALDIDSLQVEYRGGALGLDEGYYLRVAFQDPPGVRNYYRFEIFLNGERTSDIAIYDDDLTDGNRIAFPLFVEPFQLGDLVEIRAHSLDFEAYQYWESLSALIGDSPGGGDTSAPANPPSNITNGALGYFGVSAVSVAKVEIR